MGNGEATREEVLAAGTLGKTAFAFGVWNDFRVRSTRGKNRLGRAHSKINFLNARSFSRVLARESTRRCHLLLLDFPVRFLIGLQIGWWVLETSA